MKTYDYYCTWQAQNIFCQLSNIQHRDYLDEDALFKDNGLVNAYPEFRQDLYFVLDDGWDIPYTYNKEEEHPFASQIIREDRFKSFKGSPQEKLKQMVDKITSYGWKGVGIWICAHGSGNDYGKSIEELKDFFKERIMWSKFAKISYWKVDWGDYCNEVKFREMLTKMTYEIYPELIIENAMCINPVNGFNDNEEKNLMYRFPWNQNMKNYLDSVTNISEVFRSYDVTEELSTNSTLARLSYLLQNSHSIINCEDELYMGVILGCAIGIQRNKMCLSANIAPTTSFHFRCNEAIAALRYRRISPCFAGTKLNVSKEEFVDKWMFGNYWTDQISNKEVTQICPSIVARNTSLPKIEQIKEVPYVVCCKDLNNNYAIGTFKRLNYEEDEKYLVSIKADVDSLVNNIAIFSNHINTLTLHFKENIKSAKYILVDLISNIQKDITDDIIIQGNSISIPYDYLTKDFSCDDLSSKAYLIKIISE